MAIKLREAARRGDIPKPSSMLEMTSAQRREVFSKYTDKETAAQINTGFEKAYNSTREEALTNWVKNTFNAEAKKNGHDKSALGKIAQIDKEGLLTPENTDAFLEDLVRDKIGVTITAEQAKVISEKSRKLEELGKGTSEIGLQTVEYFRARSDMEKYIQSQQPAANLRVLTSTIGRGMMLASIKSPIVNIESNTVQAILTAFERRMASNQYQGLNSDFAWKFVKENWKIYQASGYDTSRMLSLDDGKLIRGEEITHSQGPGPTRAVARVVEKSVFNLLMGGPDTWFSSLHFADSANLASAKIASGEKLQGGAVKKRALEIFQDAVLIDPKTIEGELVRSQAISDAQYATYTNKSTYSDVALAIRNVLNVASGDVRVGDQIMPFVKTPANVVGAGIDYAGAALPLEIYRLPKAIIQAKNGDTQAFKRSVRRIVRAGLGMTLAFGLSLAFDPDDFIGNWPISQKEQELLMLKNATTNSVKINGKWVSLDYFGALAAPFVGIMYAKKYAHTPTEAIIKYYQGVVVQALKIPGLRDFQDIVKDITDFTNEKKTGEKELTTAATNTILSYIRSRSVPAILNDLAKGFDPLERKMDIKEDPLARIKGSVIGWRQTLPGKSNVFGDQVKAEGIISTLLFGSRVKTSDESKLVQELVRLDNKGQLPSITDVEKTSSRVKELKVQLGDRKFNQAMEYYRLLFKNKVEKAANSGVYKRGDDEAKKESINKIKSEALDTMLKKYRYRKPRK